MVIHHIFGVERLLLLVHSAYFLNDFLLVPYAALSHFFWLKSCCTQSLVPIAKDPNALVVEIWVFVLEIPGRYTFALFMKLLDGINPVAFAMWVKARA